jgi:hypothetical protein
MTLNPTANSTVKGIIYKTGSSTTGNTNVMVARSNFGAGRVVGIGDSSPCDDGTGDPNDVLYDGWIADASGNHQKLIINATIWLASSPSVNSINEIPIIENNIQIYPNPFYSSAKFIIDPYVNLSKSNLIIYDINGRIVKDIKTNNSHLILIEKENLNSGLYFYTLILEDKILGKGKFIISN